MAAIYDWALEQGNIVVESQRGLHLDLFHCLLLEEGMQCLLQVAVPEGIDLSTPYQRCSGERRLDIKQ